MLLAGKQVTQPGEILKPVSIPYVFDAIVRKGSDLANMVEQLRAIKTMQPEAYRKAKTRLPYLVCGMFQPAIRKKENFVSTTFIMLDADKLSTQSFSPSSLKKLLEKDDRILLMFTSPGNDGLKILFELDTPIHDTGYYAACYKSFATAFANQYQLQGVIDWVTHDVSRACFMSHDPDARYNPNAVKISASNLIDKNNLSSLSEAESLWKDYEHQIKELHENRENKDEIATIKNSQDLLPDVLLEIKTRIDPRLAAKQLRKIEKKAYQPIELEETLPKIQEALLQTGLVLEQSKAIEYGRQLKIKAGNHWCEINLFYGKRGFRVVKTTKTGSYAPLASIAAEALELIIDELNEGYAPA